MKSQKRRIGKNRTAVESEKDGICAVVAHRIPGGADGRITTGTNRPSIAVQRGADRGKNEADYDVKSTYAQREAMSFHAPLLEQVGYT